MFLFRKRNRSPQCSGEELPIHDDVVGLPQDLSDVFFSANGAPRLSGTSQFSDDDAEMLEAASSAEPVMVPPTVMGAPQGQPQYQGMVFQQGFPAPQNLDGFASSGISGPSSSAVAFPTWATAGTQAAASAVAAAGGGSQWPDWPEEDELASSPSMHAQLHQHQQQEMMFSSQRQQQQQQFHFHQQQQQQYQQQQQQQFFQPHMMGEWGSMEAGVAGAAAGAAAAAALAGGGVSIVKTEMEDDQIGGGAAFAELSFYQRRAQQQQQQVENGHALLAGWNEAADDMSGASTVAGDGSSIAGSSISGASAGSMGSARSRVTSRRTAAIAAARNATAGSSAFAAGSISPGSAFAPSGAAAASMSAAAISSAIAAGGSCQCEVCRTSPSADEGGRAARQCTKGHKFVWKELCPRHPLRGYCSHVNKCGVCLVNRGFCMLERCNLHFQEPSRAKACLRVHEGVADGNRGIVWTERDLSVALESKRTGNGAKRPYQSNVIRVSGFAGLSSSSAATLSPILGGGGGGNVHADVVVNINGQLHRVVAVWSNDRMQSPLLVEEQNANQVDFRLTINPAEFRSLQPLPMGPQTQRPKGIGWATVLFHVPRPAAVGGGVVPLWMWEDIPVVSDKFDKSEVQKKLPSGFKTIAAIKNHARQFAKAARGPTAASVRS